MAVVDVLVTGAAGVLGREVVNLLRPKCHVIACGRIPRENIDAVWDISCQDAPTPDCRPQTVVHAAAQIGYYNQPFLAAASLFNVNIVGTLRVANWCVLQNVKKLILVSGAIVYGGWEGLPKPECDLVNPRIAGAYAVSKWCSEKISSIVTHAGYELSILRLSSLYGKGYEKGLAQRLLEEGSTEGSIHLKPPYDDAFDFLHVTDAARTIQRSIESNLTGLWNIGGGELTTIKELAAICSRQVNARVILSGEKSSHQPRIMNWVNDAKARRELGHENSVSLEAGIAEINDKEESQYA